MRSTLVGAVALLLALTACGGDDTRDDESLAVDEQTAAAALSTHLQGERFTKAQADCISTDLVGEFGIPHLTDLQILDASLAVLPGRTRSFAAFSSRADAPRAAAVLVDCVTVAGVMKQQYQGIDDAAAECIANAFGRERLVAAMAAGLERVAAEDTPADVTAEMSACVPKE